MSKVYLKIKIKSLSEEARIIRCEEKKYTVHGRYRNLPSGERHDLNFGLHDHRVRVVKSALRSSYLAYAFIRGKKRVSVEHKCFVDPDFGEVGRLAYKYGRSALGVYDKTAFTEKLCDWLYADDQYNLGAYPHTRDDTGRCIINVLKKL
jgi:hypothetical protein